MLNAVRWDESFLWADVELLPDEFNSASIEFEVQSANTFTRNDVIGRTKVQLSIVRAKKSHRFSNKWLPLLDDKGETRGQLKITVFAIGPGDRPPGPDDKDDDDDTDAKERLKHLENAIVGVQRKNGAVKTAEYHVYVDVYRAEDLRGGQSDVSPFVSCEFSGCSLKTGVSGSGASAAFNKTMRFPCTTPLLDDSILVKMWDYRALRADTIITQGRLSFAALRTNAMAPRWFNFYSFPDNEVSDPAALLDAGEYVEPNFYVGRMLLGGRVQKIKKGDSLQPAASLDSQVSGEPAASNVVILADVFEVSGIDAEEVAVQICLGPVAEMSRFQAAAHLKKKKKGQAVEERSSGHFNFDQKSGRIPTIIASEPEESSQQRDVIINLMGKTIMGEERLGYVRLPLREIKSEEDGGAMPRWVALHPMPHRPASGAGSILVSLVRARRKPKDREERLIVQQDKYLCRAYLYSARDLRPPGDFQPQCFVEVSCAGQLATTRTCAPSRNPLFMDVVELEVSLPLTTETRRPNIEPVTISVYHEVATAGGRDGALGSAIGALSRVGVDLSALSKTLVGRVRCSHSRITPPPPPVDGYDPAARRMKPIWVELYGGAYGGKYAGDLMLAIEFVRPKHAHLLPPCPIFPSRRKIDVSLSVLGVRDLVGPSGPDTPVEDISLVVRAPTFAETSKNTRFESKVKWSKEPENPKVKYGSSDTNHKWHTEGGTSYEFLVVQHMVLEVPINPVWDPWIGLGVVDAEGTELGEAIVQLGSLLPWVKRKRAAEERLRPLEDYADPQANEDDPSDDDEDEIDLGGLDDEAGAKKDPEESATVTLSGMLKTLVKDNKGDKPSLHVGMGSTNVKAVPDLEFYVRGSVVASTAVQDDGGDEREKLRGPFEDVEDELDFVSYPLFLDDSKHRGIVKARLRLIWKDMSTPLPETVKSYAFDERQLRRKMRTSVPQHVRVRIYMIRGLGLTGRDASGFSDPYLQISYGDKVQDLRTRAREQTVNPDFHHVEERDVTFPKQSRLQIKVLDKDEYGGDDEIGRTVIDLEDRWMGGLYQRYMKVNKQPIEFRPLQAPDAGNDLSQGVLEMWIELLDSEMAADIPVTVLQEPKPVELELRLVMWDGVDLYVPEEIGTVSVVCKAALDYRHQDVENEQRQSTDVHYNSTGYVEYNWRFVWKRVQVWLGKQAPAMLTVTFFEFGVFVGDSYLGEVSLNLEDYLLKVAESGESIRMDAWLPLTNTKAQRHFDAQLNNLDDEVEAVNDDASVDSDGEGAEKLEKAKEAKEEMSKIAKSKTKFGHIHVLLEILTQSEAKSADRVVGLAREEPNRDPTLLFPKEGRSWQDVLPGVSLPALRDWLRKLKIYCGLALMLLLCAAAGYFYMMHKAKVSAAQAATGAVAPAPAPDAAATR